MTTMKRWRKALIAIRTLFIMSNQAARPFCTIDMPPDTDTDTKDEHENFVNVDPKLLADMVREKRVDCLTQFGGVEEVAALLQTDSKRGITGDLADLEHRKHVFGVNKFRRPPAKGFLPFLLESFKDAIIYVNLITTVFPLMFDIKQRGWNDVLHDNGNNVLLIISAAVTYAEFNFMYNRQFEELLEKRSDIMVEVVRSGQHKIKSIYNVVVGDVACLKSGDQVPADGLFLKGYSLKVDEFSVTGESDHVHVDGNSNPFLLSGTKVSDGFAYMLVTSVGMNTAWGEMIGSVAQDSVVLTPLQARLNKLTSDMKKFGSVVAALLLLVSLIRYFTGSTGEFHGSKTKFVDVMNAIIGIVGTAITIWEVAIPLGLPLAVNLNLASSMEKGYDDMFRELIACQTLGSVTTICTDKTGILTLNKMEVTEVWVGEQTITECGDLAPNLLQLLKEGIGLNTTGSIYQSQLTSLPEISGSPTEKAVLSWAVLDLGMDFDELKLQYEIIHMETFNSEKKRSGILAREIRGNGILTHWKGAAEVILAMCSHYYGQTGEIMIMNTEKRVQIENIIRDMAAKSLRCIAFAQKSCTEDDGHVYEKPKETGLVLLGILGLKDPCRPGVKEDVEFCKNAGVKIKMITGDNVHTARAIASESGILAPYEELDEEAVVEGCQFRNYSDEERMDKIDKIKVMARSSPDDKLLMVQCLKQKGHVVAVTGDDTNDAPALKEADVGLSMGIQGTEVAKQSSDIVILDDNFTSVVKILWRGRCACSKIQKSIQFHLTLSIAAVIMNFVAVISSGEVTATNVQQLWVIQILDAFLASVSIAEKPTVDLRKMPLAGRFEPLITKVMWGNIIAQALYQVTVVLILQFKGRSMFRVDEKVMDTLILRVFLSCQFYNASGDRKLIVGLAVGVQLAMVKIERLNWEQSGICIGIAALSWLTGLLVKCVPVVLDK